MSTPLRTSVLQSFKKLHRTRLKVFNGDEYALNAARAKINEEFQKNKHVTNEDSIKAMVKLSEEVERELRTQVIQAREVKPGVYEARISEETLKLDNVPFNEAAILEGDTGAPCCQERKENKRNARKKSPPT